jgi:hypothetical protein
VLTSEVTFFLAAALRGRADGFVVGTDCLGADALVRVLAVAFLPPAAFRGAAERAAGADAAALGAAFFEAAPGPVGALPDVPRVFVVAALALVARVVFVTAFFAGFFAGAVSRLAGRFFAFGALRAAAFLLEKIGLR